jgi:surfeit locus 1 family protein
MLVGPRLRDGKDGFYVITPLERDDGASTVLVNRGWIPKEKQNQRDRPEGVPTGEVTIEGLLRVPFKKNMFTPDNKPEDGKFYFPDVEQMAQLTRSQPIWVEETLRNCRLCWIARLVMLLIFLPSSRAHGILSTGRCWHTYRTRP